MSRGSIPLVLLAFGLGGVVGTALGGRLADLALFQSLVGANIATGLLLVVTVVVPSVVAALRRAVRPSPRKEER